MLINIIARREAQIILDVVFNIMENGRGTWLFAVPFVDQCYYYFYILVQQYVKKQ